MAKICFCHFFCVLLHHKMQSFSKMPKVLLYTTAKIMWCFLFYNKDFNENRGHVHVGKKDTTHLAKIWLEPEVCVADKGDLTDAQIKEITELAITHRSQLLTQWKNFKEGKAIRIIKIKK
ncbi:MAG: DUF4160 domain-containing protein [Paludibacteraceae bacterium]|nr:DUF4160 domain-containing protein [Paludibacteraceae bacterium]